MSNLLSRQALICSGLALGAMGCSSSLQRKDNDSPGEIDIKFSVQQYSAHKLLSKGKMKKEDYPAFVVNQCGIKGIEYWERGLEPTVAFAKSLKKRTDDLGAKNQLILCRGGKGVDHADDKEQAQSLEEVKRWSEIAAVLGCHSIRIDVRNDKLGHDGQLNRAEEGLRKAVSIADQNGLGILLENHGGYSSDGLWLKDLMTRLEGLNIHTLPDFNNWKTYDRYQGIDDMMPWAKVLCAKSLGFNADGNSKYTDYFRMFRIIKKHGFKGYVGIEYEAKDKTIEDATLLANSIKKVQSLVLKAIAAA